MTDQTPAAPAKDNILGICAAIGEDFGFNPDYLRVVLAAGILWNPALMLGCYFAMGGLVLLSRLLVPTRRRKTAANVVALPAPRPAMVEDEMALAA